MSLPVAATLADLSTFLVLLTVVGPEAEGNPVVRAAIASGLLVAVVAAKVLVVIVLLSWRLRYRVAVRLAATLVGVVGACSNALALAR